MTTGKTIALTIWIFVDKVMSLLFNMLSKFVIVFLPRSKCLLILKLQSPSSMILKPKKIKSVTVSIVSPSVCHEVIGPNARGSLRGLPTRALSHSTLAWNLSLGWVFTGDAELVTAALEPTTFLRPVHFSEKEEPSCLLCLDLNTGGSVMLNGTHLQTWVVRKW